jgi:hypothetical protein
LQITLGLRQAQLHLLALLVAHLIVMISKQALRSAGDASNQVEVPQQSVSKAHRVRWPFALTPSLQKQRRLLDQPSSHLPASVPPGVVQLADVPIAQLQWGYRLDQLLAVLSVGARHWHQVLPGCVGTDPPSPHLLLHHIRQRLHQRQTACHPAHTAIELLAEIFKGLSKATVQR